MQRRLKKRTASKRVGFDSSSQLATLKPCFKKEDTERLIFTSKLATSQ
jgi:hypothetical protein